VSDEHGTAGTVEIALLEGERLADPQPRAPEQDDQRAEPVAVRAIANRPHDGDDLLDRRRVGRVLLALLCRPCGHADVALKFLADCGDRCGGGLHDRGGCAELLFCD
jgi:hypothetical protein